jgi:hypothetical protein
LSFDDIETSEEDPPEALSLPGVELPSG